MKIISDKTDAAVAELISRLGKALASDVSGKAMLYFIPLFLTPFADKLGPSLLDGKYPTGPAIFGCTLLGTIAGCYGLKAYYDGSYQRNKDEKPPVDSP